MAGYGQGSMLNSQTKYPFWGSKEDDETMKTAARTITGSALPKVGDTLNNTVEAYKAGGLPAAAGAYVRGTVADAGRYLVDNPIVNPVKRISGGLADFGKTLITGDPTPIGQQPSGPALKADSGNTGPAMSQTGSALKPFKATLPGGIEYTGDMQGNRTFTMGTPGQDGFGRMTVRSGSALPTPAAPASTTGSPGLSITGPADAIERFNRPVGGPPTEVPTGRMIDPISPDYSFLKSGDQSGVPKYLGPESGLGWKTRLAKYKEDMDNYRQQMGSQAALNLEGMREAGAGQRALLTAKGINDRNAIEQQQVDQQASQFQAGAALRDAELQGKQIALGDVKTMQALKDTMMRTDPSSPEYQAAYLRWAALNGRNENNYGVLEQHDENGQKVGEVLYHKASGAIVNPKGAALQEPPPLPNDRSKYQIGVTYKAPNGAYVAWDGKGLLSAK